MGALGESVMGRGRIAVGYGFGSGRVVSVEVSGEREEEEVDDVELVDVVSAVVEVSRDDVKDGVVMVAVGG